MANLVGKTLGKYQITELLGKGGMAEVYKAYHPKLERYVAIKVLYSFLAEGEDFLGRFSREAKAVASLRHPHIVQIHDFDIEDDYYYMVVEFISGGTLQSRMGELSKSSRYMPVSQVISIIRQVADALDYAHSKGIIHRDIKPSNILLDSTGDAFLADFGIARIMGGTQFTATGSMIGTPTYMSPEQGMGDDLTAISDIYSLGVILFELLTGKVPFTSNTTPLAIIHKHINVPPPNPRALRPDLTEAVEQVVLKALAKDPIERYQSGGELVRALEKALPQEIVERLDSSDAQAGVTISTLPTKLFESAGPDANLTKLPAIAVEEATKTEIASPPPINNESAQTVYQPIAAQPSSEIARLQSKSKFAIVREEWGKAIQTLFKLIKSGLRSQPRRDHLEKRINVKSPDAAHQPVAEQPSSEIAPLQSKSKFEIVREEWGKVIQIISKWIKPGPRTQHLRDRLHKHLPNARITIWWIIGIVIVGMLVVVGVLMKTGILTFTSAQMPGTKGQLNSPVSEANGYLYFTSDKNGKAEIWMMDPKGQIVQVTHTPDPYESWSPAPAANGYIYFTSDKNGKAEVWMMDPKGQIVQVTHTPDPDESWVFYFNKPHSNPKR